MHCEEFLQPDGLSQGLWELFLWGSTGQALLLQDEGSHHTSVVKLGSQRGPPLAEPAAGPPASLPITSLSGRGSEVTPSPFLLSSQGSLEAVGKNRHLSPAFNSLAFPRGEKKRKRGRTEGKNQPLPPTQRCFFKGRGEKKKKKAQKTQPNSSDPLG